MLPSCFYGERDAENNELIHKPKAIEIFFAVTALVNWGSDLIAYQTMEGYFEELCDWDNAIVDWCALNSTLNSTNTSVSWLEYHAIDDDDYYGRWAYKTWDQLCPYEGDDSESCFEDARGSWRGTLMTLILIFVIVELVWDAIMSFSRWRTVTGREQKGRTKRTKVKGIVFLESWQAIFQFFLLAYFVRKMLYIAEHGATDINFRPYALEASLGISCVVMILNCCFLCAVVDSDKQRDIVGAKGAYSAASKAESGGPVGVALSVIP